MKYFLFILVSICSLAVSAQSIRGKVADATTNAPLYPVTVVNMLTQQHVYTNEHGEFTINAKGGEQLAFSYVGYKSVQRLILSGEQNIRIEMQPLTVHMNELVVRPQDYTPYQLDSIQRKSTYKRTLARQKSSVMSPFSFVAERISKSSKRIFRFQESFNYWEDQRFIDSRYTPELVSQMTGLEDDSLAHFMNAYPMPYDYARTATDLELKMWVRSRYKEWVKNPVVPVIKADSTFKK